MQVQINTDHSIEGHELFAGQVRGVVETALSRFTDHITRVEVHLSGEHSRTSGRSDMDCMVEARLEGRQPVAVTHQAATVEEAVQGAAEKMARKLDSTMGRLKDQRHRRTDPPPPRSNTTESS